MTAFLSISLCIVAILTKSWRSFYKYHSTILYVALMNLLYNFICVNYYLWEWQSDIFTNHQTVGFFLTFLFLPSIVILFLHFYPFNHKAPYIYIFLWALGLWIWEVSFVHVFHKLSYGHGWSIWWSALFYLIMLPMIVLHSKRPIVAYGLSIIIIIILINIFNVPVDTPIELRS